MGSEIQDGDFEAPVVALCARQQNQLGFKLYNCGKLGSQATSEETEISSSFSSCLIFIHVTEEHSTMPPSQ